MFVVFCVEHAGANPGRDPLRRGEQAPPQVLSRVHLFTYLSLYLTIYLF